MAKSFMSSCFKAAIYLLALFAANASAYDYSGRTTLGAYQLKEKQKQASAGQQSNDRRDYIGRLFFDSTGIGSSNHQFTLDLRDRYQEFGQVDPDELTLIPSNEPHLRELAYKSPPENGRVYWSLGRMPVHHAGVVGLDGIELGFGIQPNFRIGTFGGLIPYRFGNKNLEPNTAAQQLGTYAVYRDNGSEWFNHSYITNALIFEQKHDFPEVLPSDPEETGVPSEIEMQTDEKEQVSSLHWFHSAIFQRGKQFRLTSLAFLYLMPNPYLRNGSLIATSEFHPMFIGSLKLVRIDLEQYRRTRDVRERLVPSDYNQVSVDLKYKFIPQAAFILTPLYGVRGKDQLSRTQIQGGVTVSQLISKKFSGSLLLGSRKNFLSTDTYVKLGFNIYHNRLDLEFDQQFIKEKLNDGPTLNPMISSIMLNFLIKDPLMGSIGAEYVKDERTTINSFLATLSFRFGNRQPTPMRTKAPPPERIGTESL